MNLTNLMDFVQNFGLWAALFIYTFFTMTKENKAREEKLIATLNNFASQTGEKLDKVVVDVAEIKSDVEELKKK